MASSARELRRPHRPVFLDPLPALAPPSTSHQLPVAAPNACNVLYAGPRDQTLANSSAAIQARSFFLPDYSPAAAAPEFVSLASDLVNGQYFRNLNCSSPGDSMLYPQCTFLANVPSTQGIAETAGWWPICRDDSRRHSTVKEDCHPLSARDQSLRKQRVVKESLRRKKMSRWFSKLEVLLPQEDICKFDRCSVIDAAIKYIRSLETIITESSQNKGSQKLEPINRSTEPGRLPNPGVGNEQGTGESVVMVSTNLENAFVNAISCQRDPTHFSSVLSVLQKHKLEVVAANLAQSDQTVVYSAHAKIPTAVDFCSKRLQEQIYNCITSSPLEVTPEVKELSQP